MIEPSFTDDLHLLAKALRHGGFRFVLIGHNRRTIYTDIAAWLRAQFPDHPFLELRFEGKDYRYITEELRAFVKGIVLIPDFDWLFREENRGACVAFNQRRDAFGRLDLALLCFVQPSNFALVPKKVPDWWSLRSLELEFHSDAPDTPGEFLKTELEISSLGGGAREYKEAEIDRLLRQIEDADPGNKSLLLSLHSQVGELYFQLSAYENAFSHFEKSLTLSREIGDSKGEGESLNNISQIHMVKGDYETALKYLQQSLKISLEIGDRKGEGVSLNILGGIAIAKGDYETALRYLQQDLNIMQDTGNRHGEGATLNNLSQIYKAIGHYGTALSYLEHSLKIMQDTSDRHGEGAILNNIGQIHKAKGDYDSALHYLQQSLKIHQGIGDQLSEGRAMNNLSQIHRTKGDYDTALKYLQQSLRIQQEIGDIIGMASTLNNIGGMLFEQNRLAEAVPLLVQAHGIFQRIDSPNLRHSAGYLAAIIEKIGQARYDQILQNLQNK